MDDQGRGLTCATDFSPPLSHPQTHSTPLCNSPGKDAELSRCSGFLRRLLGRVIAVSRQLDLAGLDRLGVRLARDVEEHVLDSAAEGLAALPDREQTDTEEGTEDPDDTDSNPAGEELLAEDVAGAVERHGPKNQEAEGLLQVSHARIDVDVPDSTYHDDRDSLADLAGLLQLLQVLLSLVAGLTATRDILEIKTRLLSKVVVVTLADLEHRLPVVLVKAKDEGEDSNEDNRRQQGGNVASQHGVVGASARDRQLAALLLGCHEPSSQRADKAQNGGEGRRPLVLT